MRLIDADALKENIENWYALVNKWGQTRITLSHDNIIGKIDNQPTVDILEQIRTEIEQHNSRPFHYPCDMIGVGTVLQIIDKYTKEQTE